MLLIEVKVPALCGRYDFELEETASVEVLIQEIAAVICQKERCQCWQRGQELRLYSQDLEHQRREERAEPDFAVKWSFVPGTGPFVPFRAIGTGAVL